MVGRSGFPGAEHTVVNTRIRLGSANTTLNRETLDGMTRLAEDIYSLG